MTARSRLFAASSWPKQRIVVAVLLAGGLFIYIFLIHGYLNRLEERFDLFVSSAFNIGNTNDAKATVRLVATGSSALKSGPLFCRNEHNEEVKARIREMGGAHQCEWWNFFVDCAFEQPAERVVLFGAMPGEMVIPVRPKISKKFSLVVCFSRMFFFENWQVALLTLETYRRFGVQHFSVPVISVIEGLFKVLKHYERHELLTIRNGVVLPKIDGRDPNTQTEFFNQLISNTECLYEYREAAEFVAFVDFDDLIVPRSSPSLVDELRALSAAHPLASSFEFQWTRANIPTPSFPEEFRMEEILQRSYFLDTHTVGKTIAIPSRITTGLMHRPWSSREIDGNFTHVILDGNHSLAVHLRPQKDEFEAREPNDYFRAHDLSQLTADFRHFLQWNQAVYKAFLDLPRTHVYLPSMVDCYLEFGRKLREGTLAECPNPLVCRPPEKIEANCVVLGSSLERLYVGGGLHVHRAAKAELVFSSSCSPL